jgi:hypothetical protein
VPAGALVLLVALAIAGCGNDDEPAAPAPAGQLSVEQALEVSSDEPVLVRGFLVVADEARLCTALAESYPPQCGGPSLVVTDLPARELRGLKRAQGVAWSETLVALHGFVEDGVLGVLDYPG